PIYGRGDNIRDWLFVEDHCRALLLVLEQGAVGETYNIAGGQEKPNLDLERLITFVADRPGHDWRYALDTGKIEAHLGWRPQVTLEQGLRDTVSWYLAQAGWLERVRSRAYRDFLRQQYGAAVAEGG